MENEWNEIGLTPEKFIELANQYMDSVKKEKKQQDDPNIFPGYEALKYFKLGYKVQRLHWDKPIYCIDNKIYCEHLCLNSYSLEPFLHDDWILIED